MRPEEVWDKAPGPDGGAGGPRRRGSQAKKENPGSFSQHSASEHASGGCASSSHGSSPADTNERPSDNQDPQLPTTTRPRAASVQLGRAGLDSTRLTESTAVVALQRAIQSSPVRCRTMQNADTVIKDLTPRPTRRILFPSPAQREKHKPLHSNVAEYKKNNTRTIPWPTREASDSADKENLPPQPEHNERAVFDELPQRSVTPTPTSKSCDMPFKTPSRSLTPDCLPPTTGDFFSSAAKALLRPHSTPKHTSSRTNALPPLGEISPFTAQINSILSDARGGSPSGNIFDFPSLPPLSNTPNRVRHDFDFSQFDPQDLLSTDVPMASSPPIEGWFGVYEDPVDREENFWDNYPFPGSSPPATASQSSSAKKVKTPTALSVDSNGRARIDFATLAESGG